MMTTFDIIRDRKGVMYTNLPTVAELNRADHCFDYGGIDPEDFKNWRCVASDPHFQAYFDEATEAMDEANWDKVMASLTDRPVRIDGPHPRYVRGLYSAEGGARVHNTDLVQAWRTGLALVPTLEGYVLIMAPDMSEDVKTARELVQRF